MSAENINAAASLDRYGQEEDLFSVLVRYGLFMGAIFQFICIASAVLMGSNEDLPAEDPSGETIDEPAAPANAARRLQRIRKLEKKKRR